MESPRLVFIIIILIFNLKNIQTCTFKINEINVDDPQKEELGEYIELKKINCGNEQPSLEPYLLIIVKEYEQQYNNPIVVFSADLSASTYPRSSQFFVIGAPSINPHLTFNSAQVSYRKKFRTPLQIDLQLKIDYEKKQLNDAIENGNKVPLSILLLKENNVKQVGLKQLIMTVPEVNRRSKGFSKPVAINDDLAQIIKIH